MAVQSPLQQIVNVETNDEPPPQSHIDGSWRDWHIASHRPQSQSLSWLKLYHQNSASKYKKSTVTNVDGCQQIGTNIEYYGYGDTVSFDCIHETWTDRTSLESSRNEQWSQRIENPVNPNGYISLIGDISTNSLTLILDTQLKQPSNYTANQCQKYAIARDWHRQDQQLIVGTDQGCVVIQFMKHDNRMNHTLKARSFDLDCDGWIQNVLRAPTTCPGNVVSAKRYSWRGSWFLYNALWLKDRGCVLCFFTANVKGAKVSNRCLILQLLSMTWTEADIGEMHWRFDCAITLIPKRKNDADLMLVGGGRWKTCKRHHAMKWKHDMFVMEYIPNGPWKRYRLPQSMAVPSITSFNFVTVRLDTANCDKLVSRYPSVYIKNLLPVMVLGIIIKYCDIVTLHAISKNTDGQHFTLRMCALESMIRTAVCRGASKFQITECDVCLKAMLPRRVVIDVQRAKLSVIDLTND